MTQITSEYTKTLQKGDFTMPATVVLPTGSYVDLMTFQVPFKNRYFVGNGRINLGVDDRGTFKLDVETSAPANIPGVSRILLRDANGISSKFLREDLSADAVTGVKVGQGGKTGNEKPMPAVGERSYIVIQYNATTGATATLADSSINLPVTIQALA